jgi:hypothetical protein
MSVETKLHVHGDNSGDITFETTQDAEPILRFAQEAHKAGEFGSGDMRHAARLPMVAIDRYCHVNGITFEEWMKDKKHVRAMLSDPDLSGFRIWKGRV